MLDLFEYAASPRISLIDEFDTLVAKKAIKSYTFQENEGDIFSITFKNDTVLELFWTEDKEVGIKFVK